MADFAEVGPGTTIATYRFLRVAGEGTFCKVWWAEDSEGKPFAVKVFGKTILDHRYVAFFDEDGATTVPLRTRIDEELRLLRLLQHDGVVRLQEVIDEPAQQELFVVLEGLAGGQLMEWKDELPGYTVASDPQAVQRFWGDAVTCEAAAGEAEAAGRSAAVYQEGVAIHLLQHLLQAVAYLHASRVVHKDLKPDNLLLSAPVPALDERFVRHLSLSKWPEISAQGPSGPIPSGAESGRPSVRALLEQSSFVVKVADFNSALEGERIYDAEGTTAFTPPECFDLPRGGILGKPRDMWSLGCVLFVALFGRCPYWAEEPINMQLSIMMEEYALPVGVVSSGAEDLVRKLMAREVSERLSASEALEHAWLRGA